MNFRVPKLMHAVLLSGHGGMEKLELRKKYSGKLVLIPTNDNI